MIHSGKFLAGMPTWGSWVIYALGSENRDLPAYVVLSDPGGLPVDGVRNWTVGWLPAVYQGTAFRSGKLAGAQPGDAGRNDCLRPARGNCGFSTRSIARTWRQYPDNSELEARIANFEIAARMQTAVPDVLDLSQETRSDEEALRTRQPEDGRIRHALPDCPPAGRAGVRFVQIYLAGQPWDTHSKNAATLKDLCRADRSAQRRPGAGPEAARPARPDDRDVERRIRPAADLAGQGRPRPQPPRLFPLAGRRRLQARLLPRRTDDFGYEAVEKVVTVHDLHATLLHALGLDHKRLTYPHEGRQGSLTDVAITKAEIVPDLLA